MTSYLTLGATLIFTMVVWVLLVSGCEGLIDIDGFFSRGKKFCIRVFDSLREDS